ncbi:MAG: TetR family transcriptional regulator [Ruminobacter sp.]|jgi:TetR/AcrR family acrAB operon transcriptional repressor|uniref:Transcriptional regulator, TetR family n=1 Tax=Ruminobacter amylophilus TaxID=867 RepID=A0A662ZJR0_9GAMM|nr:MULTISPECIES: TetR family transcriptional regulator [Ruminobacter]MBQ3774599.1 TetR family transcriptional regulator [Ruminobacter sp.]SFP52307.1 transcriptional regulator, TetR family [Ruminobacter amylophilus]
MVRKTREEALKTKLKIMDVAKQLFCEKGYEKTNLSDIADVAGVTRGAIYWYFQNKDDLFVEICKAMVNTESNLFHSIENIDSSVSPLDSLRQWLYTINVSLKNEDNILFSKIIYNVLWGNHGSKRVKKMLMDINNSFNRNYVLLIREAIKKHELPSNVDAEKAANFLCSVITGYIIRYVDGSQDDIIHYNKQIVDLILDQIPKFVF